MNKKWMLFNIDLIAKFQGYASILFEIDRLTAKYIANQHNSYNPLKCFDDSNGCIWGCQV